MKATLDKILAWPPIAHLLAANTRFNTRLGPQFAAAITYFSVLSLVPIVMFAFSMLGMTLTVLRPDLLEQVQAQILDMLGDGPGESVSTIVKNALSNWRGIGIIAILTAGYSGSGWAGNLKKAVRMLWRRVPLDEERKVNPVLDIAQNIAIFIGLLITLALGIVVAQAGSSASSLVVNWLGLQDIPGIGLLIRLATVLLTFVASWLLMAFLFGTLPDERVPMKSWLAGVTFGAVLITILQQLAGTLMGVFSGNAAASVFGPVIIMMLLLNLLFTVVLLMAAWISTSDDDGLTEAKSRATEVAAMRSAEARAGFVPNPPDEPAMVRQDVADRGVRAGIGVGYGVGTATGVGIGAVLTAIVAFIAGLLKR